MVLKIRLVNHFKHQNGLRKRKVIPSTDHVFDRYWSGDILKGAFTGPTGMTSKKFWTRPKKGTVMRLVKNPKTGKYENVYVEP